MKTIKDNSPKWISRVLLALVAVLALIKLADFLALIKLVEALLDFME